MAGGSVGAQESIVMGLLRRALSLAPRPGVWPRGGGNSPMSWGMGEPRGLGPCCLLGGGRGHPPAHTQHLAEAVGGDGPWTVWANPPGQP